MTARTSAFLRRPGLLTADQQSLVMWLALLGYFILAGGTPGGEFNGLIRAVNGGIAIVLIARWTWALRAENDMTDRWMLGALLAFLAACILSMFPRQSLDAAIQATAFVAAFYFARRRLPADLRARVEAAGGCLCLVLSVIVLAAWGANWYDWLRASGGSAPPLNLPLSTVPFGNRHDVALLVMLLVPFLWTRAFQNRRPIAVIGSALALVIVLVDSSRNLELAALASSSVVVAGHWLHLGTRQIRIMGGFLAATSIAAIALVVSFPALVSRMANIATILTRISLWNESGGVWLSHALAGVGPGGFPFSYMLSDHFHFSLFDPRHPDNAVVQLLVEGGLLGIAAATACVAALILGARPRWRGEACAVWALLFFAFATVGANPSDFVFLVVPALVWASFLVPAEAATPSRRDLTQLPRRSSVRSLALTMATSLVAAAVVATGIASITYQMGSEAYRRGDVAGAESALDVSIALDPSLAIYRRERASLAFARGEWSRAMHAYHESLAVNKYDPVAWRGLALTELAMSDATAAVHAAKAATGLMFLSPENQLVLAAAAEGDPRTSATAIRIALQQAPQLALIRWDGTILGFADRLAATQRAVDARPPTAGADFPFGQLVLAILTGRSDVVRIAAAGVAPGVRLSASSLAAVAACDSDGSARLIDRASKVEGELGPFWIARSVVSAASGGDHERAVAMTLRFLNLTDGPGDDVVSALAGDRSDTWRYRRNALNVRSRYAALPSSQAGLWLLLTDPAMAFSRLGTSWPPGCL